MTCILQCGPSSLRVEHVSTEDRMTTPDTNGADAMRPLTIEFLFLDRETCRRCRETEPVIDHALAQLRPVLATLGIAPVLRKLHVTDAEQALAWGLTASPTVRIDGHDLQPEITVNRCSECGTLCGCAEGIDCRVWRWSGGESAVLPAALFTQAVLGVALTGPAGAVETAGREGAPGPLPSNLQRFFEAGQTADAAGCCAPGASALQGESCCS